MANLLDCTFQWCITHHPLIAAIFTLDVWVIPLSNRPCHLRQNRVSDIIAGHHSLCFDHSEVGSQIAHSIAFHFWMMTKRRVSDCLQWHWWLCKIFLWMSTHHSKSSFRLRFPLLEIVLQAMWVESRLYTYMRQYTNPQNKVPSNSLFYIDILLFSLLINRHSFIWFRGTLYSDCDEYASCL